MGTLRTDYTDRTWEGDRKYTITDNGDDTYTIEDVTEYENDEYSAFGAADINATNEKVNEIGDGNLNNFSFYQISSTQGGYSMDGGETIIPFRNPTGDAEESDVLDGAIFSSAELEDAEGTMTDKQGTTTTATPSLDSTNEYLKMKVPARGCYDTSSYLRATYSTIRSLISLTAAKIRSGYTILGLAGTFTSNATATAARILKGYTAGVNGSMVTGTMTNRGAVSVTIDPGESYTVTAGYHNGSGTVTANSATLTKKSVGSKSYSSYGTSSATFTCTSISGYSSLNASNFFIRDIKVACAARARLSGGGYWSASGSLDLGWSYSSSTGVLTVSGMSTNTGDSKYYLYLYVSHILMYCVYIA